jgi:hypothetical protein
MLFRTAAASAWSFHSVRPHVLGARARFMVLRNAHTRRFRLQGILNSLATGYAIAGLISDDASAAAIALPFHLARFEAREA